MINGNLLDKELTCFNDIYRDRRVLVTGHTGFKGTWLTQWLQLLGANIFGYSLPAETDPNHFSLLSTAGLTSQLGDIRDSVEVEEFVGNSSPEIVFHLAAQPLVRRSYREPLNTFSTNVIGTLNVLQACQKTQSVRAVVCVTSDKVYENFESSRGYVETDRLGGSDPYSCSKACTELLANCFRSSYLPNAAYGKLHNCLLATVRAGNVIGGGDWSEDRLIPDSVRAVTTGQSMLVRNPVAVRPWQHVLEPLSGYLMVGQKLLEGKVAFADSWNFGPADDADVSVGNVIQEMMRHWPEIKADLASVPEGPHETKVLKVDSAKAMRLLPWRPTWSWKQAVAATACWYRQFHCSHEVRTLDDFKSYVQSAHDLGMEWVTA